MCGILGILSTNQCPLSPEELARTTEHLFRLSETRGKEASGVALLKGKNIFIYKQPTPASEMLKSDQYKELIKKHFQDGTEQTVIGHTRLVTSGEHARNMNNQPLRRDGQVLVHNGIITNVDELWSRFPEMKRELEVDTEIVPALIQRFRADHDSLSESIVETFKQIEGATTIASLFEKEDSLLLATNHGSLYLAHLPEKITLFASERHTLLRLLSKEWLATKLSNLNVKQIPANHGCHISLKDLRETTFNFDQPRSIKMAPHEKRVVTEMAPSFNIPPVTRADVNIDDHLREFDRESIDKLTRCQRCILPETFPYIDFDSEGVCNYCRHYQKKRLEDPSKISNFKTNKKCLIPLSGGRDSSYTLHYVKCILGLDPVAYTYDWGMVTDLARRNISRMCGKLGVEHLLVSADIPKKRTNIRCNVSAWLRRPRLGLVPIFMAGDKHYFYHADQIMRQNNIETVIYGENPFEKTDFKAGFCGIKPNHQRGLAYDLSFMNKMRMAVYYLKEFLLNPAFFNRSLWDSLTAYFIYYGSGHSYWNLFNFVEWDEETINRTLLNEYSWEKASDTESTWRIGDGTAAFYNYIYYHIAGFTENDTFRSHQIREGKMDRNRALERVLLDNQARVDAISWYCDTIGLDTNETLRAIKRIRPIYAAK